MKYLLTIYNNEADWANISEEESKQILDAYFALTREVQEAGVMLGGEGLQPTQTATTVRVRGGERQLTDGPFAETKEQLGGFYLLECKNLDEAIDWAAKIPGAQRGSVEVRPVMLYEQPGAEEQRATEGAAS
jgi:hypothetical protein